jgi:hypothetical protein
MDSKTLIKYLLISNVNTETIGDVYFNNVDLLLRLDNSINPYGLPIYKDYSSRQRQLRYFIGSNTQSDILFVNTSDNNYNNYPNINKELNNNNNNNIINSFIYIPNKYNQNLRLAQLNANTLYGSIKGTFFEVLLNGQQPINFGNNDFTIEFSFYADSVTLPWKYQVILSYGNVFAVRSDLTLSNINNYILTTGNGYAIYLANNNLNFYDGNQEYVISTNILANNWYHVCLQKISNKLQSFINFNLVNTYTNYNKTFNYASSGLNTNTTL